MNAAVAVTVVTTDKSSSTMIRREVLDMDPTGHMMLRDQDENEASQITECNKQFLVMAEGENDCTGSGGLEVIDYEGDCVLAAQELAKVNSAIEAAPKDNSSTGLLLNTHLVNPLPYPQGCFLNTTTNKIHVNLAEVNSTATPTLTGKKICMRSKYINGTANTNPDTGSSDDSKPILTYDECWAAAACVAGTAPKLVAFKENKTDYKPTDKPIGCFKDKGGQASGDTAGYWGFNYAETAPAGTLTGTPVCINEVASANSVAAAAISNLF